MELKGKVALITGGGTGLGREIARQYANEGMQVAVNYSRSKEDAEDTVRELKELGIEAKAFQANVAERSELERMLNEVAETFGRLDVLVNNAGVTKFVAFPDMDLLDEEAWDNILGVNVKAPFFAARAAAPIMRQKGGGCVINTTSIAGSNTRGSSLAYCTSKAGLNHLTRCLAVALAPDIRVNGVAPGLLLTRWGGLWSDEDVKRFAENAALKTVTSIPACASAYVLLAKNESMTGQIITVDAGLTV